ncbi:MAG: septal ring lytic transglycosylase RlpA family protein [Polyangiaceae bacterium]
MLAGRRCPPRFVRLSGAAALTVPLLTSCAHREQPGPREPRRDFAGASPEAAPRGEVQVGYATWYGARLAGRRTASGDRFDPNELTAAHRFLPFGTWLEVKRVDTGASVRVRVTDRGPFGHEERIIDLSRAAAQRIGMLHSGVTKVELRIVDGP